MKNKVIKIGKVRLEDQGKETDLDRTTPAERVAMVHVMTRNAWAFRGIDIDQQRLQKHIVRFRRLGS
ncbi:MAG: hypothetical protein P1S46_07490 [bacterium]|nr:hypothetical protein [bacterium]